MGELESVRWLMVFVREASQGKVTVGSFNVCAR